MAQRFTVPRDSSLLECLFELFPQQSRTGVKAYLKDGRVIVNGVNRTAFDWLLKKGDTIEILSKGASIGRDMKEDADSLLRREGISIVFGNFTPSVIFASCTSTIEAAFANGI